MDLTDIDAITDVPTDVEAQTDDVLAVQRYHNRLSLKSQQNMLRVSRTVLFIVSNRNNVSSDVEPQADEVLAV